VCADLTTNSDETNGSSEFGSSIKRRSWVEECTGDASLVVQHCSKVGKVVFRYLGAWFGVKELLQRQHRDS
jgi:hypothetical protein